MILLAPELLKTVNEDVKTIAKKIGESKLTRWVKEHIVPVTGDITKKRLGMSKEDYHALTQEDPLDVSYEVEFVVSFCDILAVRLPFR